MTFSVGGVRGDELSVDQDTTMLWKILRYLLEQSFRFSHFSIIVPASFIPGLCQIEGPFPSLRHVEFKVPDLLLDETSVVTCLCDAPRVEALLLAGVSIPNSIFLQYGSLKELSITNTFGSDILDVLREAPELQKLHIEFNNSIEMPPSETLPVVHGKLECLGLCDAQGGLLPFLRLPSLKELHIACSLDAQVEDSISVDTLGSFLESCFEGSDNKLLKLRLIDYIPDEERVKILGLDRLQSIQALDFCVNHLSDYSQTFLPVLVYAIGGLLEDDDERLPYEPRILFADLRRFKIEICNVLLTPITFYDAKFIKMIDFRRRRLEAGTGENKGGTLELVHVVFSDAACGTLVFADPAIRNTLTPAKLEEWEREGLVHEVRDWHGPFMPALLEPKGTVPGLGSDLEKMVTSLNALNRNLTTLLTAAHHNLGPILSGQQLPMPGPLAEATRTSCLQSPPSGIRIMVSLAAFRS
jgi:hypothetical protein